ncbi:MAG: transcriptional regulator FeaR [Pseudomonas sp.]|nr:transcriptional regulator FeaR [Pseudomonas sp.]
MLLNSVINNDFEKWISNVNQVCGPFSANPVNNNFLGTVEKVGGFLDMSRVNIKNADLFRTSEHIKKSESLDVFCVFQISGDSSLEQAGNRFFVNCGDIVLIDASTPFRFSYHAQSQQLSLILPRHVFEKVINLRKLELSIKIPAHSHIANFAKTLIIEASSYENIDNEEGTAILESLATLLKPSLAKKIHISNPYDRIFRTATEYINDNISDPDITALKIAKAIGVSLRNLYRAFSHNQITISQYIKNQRLEMSLHYMQAHNGMINITEMLYRFGFSNPSYFSTLFKEHYNMTPTEYRNTIIKNQTKKT